ncbi:MAG: WD40 repeat domain-containing protein [Candidatus Kapaibacterium sp.]
MKKYIILLLAALALNACEDIIGSDANIKKYHKQRLFITKLNNAGTSTDIYMLHPDSTDYAIWKHDAMLVAPPRGEMIFYMEWADGPGSPKCYISGPDGRNPMLAFEGELKNYDISPDYSKIAIASTDGMYTSGLIWDINNQKMFGGSIFYESLVEPPWLKFSPDGRTLAIAKTRQERSIIVTIELINVESSTTDYIYTANNLLGVNGLDWFPDGESVLLLTRTVEHDTMDVYSFTEVPLDGGMAKDIQTSRGPNGRVHHPMLSPDGESLIATMWDIGLLLLDVQFSAPEFLNPQGEELEGDAYILDWSPDGNNILYLSGVLDENLPAGALNQHNLSSRETYSLIPGRRVINAYYMHPMD